MSAAWVALLLTLPWRWLPAFEVGPLARESTPEHREERALPARTPVAPIAPPTARTAVLPDELVIHAIDDRRSAFHACWKRALKNDPLLDATKIQIHVELDADGTVVAVTHDAANEKLGACLVMVARGLQFGAPGQKAVAEFPLFFQPE